MWLEERGGHSMYLLCHLDQQSHCPLSLVMIHSLTKPSYYVASIFIFMFIIPLHFRKILPLMYVSVIHIKFSFEEQ